MTMTATLTEERSTSSPSAARRHCVGRLLERYGAKYSLVCYGDANSAYLRHCQLLVEGKGTRLYKGPDGSWVVRLYDRGRTYYPVLKRSWRIDTEEVVVTYLSKTMVRR